MPKLSTLRLAGRLCERVQVFIRQEIQLAIREMTEKLASYRSGIIEIGIGSAGVFAGLMVLLVGLGLLLSFLFQTFGLDLIPARMLGFGAAGLLVAIAGTLLLLKAVKVFSKLSLAPSRTLSTIPNMPERSSTSRGSAKVVAARPARELEHDVLETEKRVAVALQDLARRASPTYYINAGVQRVRSHPLRWSLIALLTGVASSVWFVRRLQRSNS